MRDQATVAGMMCPVCRTGLAMSDRQGIEIDYCPTCRGVWLDRGELDKIIERSMAAASASTPAQPQPAPAPQPQPVTTSNPLPGYAQPVPPAPGYAQPGYGQPGYGSTGIGLGGWGSSSGYGYGKKRRKSFLEELFD